MPPARPQDRTWLNAIPQEVLEHVAFFAATGNFLGPPSGLCSLLLTSRRLHSSLSIAFNPHLYARIFTSKFDVEPAIRRLGSEILTVEVLSAELQRRCIFLRRIKSRSGCVALGDHEQSKELRELLWMAFFMMIENDGKNARQLREYSGLRDWLDVYWMDPDGASGAAKATRNDRWPSNNESNALAMWLYWFLFDPHVYSHDDRALVRTTNMMKIVAQGAHMYPISTPSWTIFAPGNADLVAPANDSLAVHYGVQLRLSSPPMAAAAILSYLALMNSSKPTSPRNGWIFHAPSLPPTCPSAYPDDSYEWESVWLRCFDRISQDKLGYQHGDSARPFAFMPGSLEGVWEGPFTYTEFTAYAALLSGASPAVLNNSLVAQHRQTWRLREYYLLAPLSADERAPDVLPSGDPLQGYMPQVFRIQEELTHLEVQESDRRSPLHYSRFGGGQDGESVRQNVHQVKESWRRRSLDVIVTGEGHSAWGQFSLLGRVRPCDGFVSLIKEYVDGDRGKWLYRGYLAGDINGDFSGRWRDTLSPPHVPGYEGCFAMKRRR